MENELKYLCEPYIYSTTSIDILLINTPNCCLICFSYFIFHSITFWLHLKPGKMKWEDLPINLLLQIFKELNPIDHGAVARVCHLWRMTYLDSSLWRIVDLGSLRSNSIWVNTRIRLSQALRNMVTYGRVNIRCIIFHPQLLIKDEHLNLIAQG